MKPTLSELEKFEDQPDGVDVECILIIINISHIQVVFFFGTAVAVIWQWVYFGAIGEFD